MSKNVAKVIKCFRNREACRGDSKGTCSTDGNVVWSYRMPIAWRVDRCIDHTDCEESEAVGRACAAQESVRVIAYNLAPTNTTRSQVRALEYEFPRALRAQRRMDMPFVEVGTMAQRRKHR